LAEDWKSGMSYTLALAIVWHLGDSIRACLRPRGGLVGSREGEQAESSFATVWALFYDVEITLKP
jgi:hypothetical protein